MFKKMSSRNPQNLPLSWFQLHQNLLKQIPRCHQPSRRMIPKINAFPDSPEIKPSQECLDEVNQEIIDLDELVNDEAFDEELDELEDSEMVIDETNS